MNLSVNGPFEESADVLMLWAGYARHPHGESYMKRIRGDWYPRFHVYLTLNGEELEISIHIDQKEHSYQGTNRHQGEYDTPIVTTEAERLRSHFLRYAAPESRESKEKPSFWKRLIG